MRLLMQDHTLTLPRSSLFAVEFQRATGGWQVTICLGDGRELAGAVRRPSKESARRAAMASAMTFVVNTVHDIALAAMGRAEAARGSVRPEVIPSSASSSQAPRLGCHDG